MKLFQIITTWLTLGLFLGVCATGIYQKSKITTVASFDVMLIPKDTVDNNYLMGKFDPSKHPDFVSIDRKYCSSPGMYLRKETYKAFLDMRFAASKDGVKLIIISATRNFDNQKHIWEAKWNGQTIVDGLNLSKAIPDLTLRSKKILEYSSMPGSSRHHWGTDMDLNELTNAYFDKGKGYKIYHWLQTHAATYGFCQPYSAKGPLRPAGYNEERWHWSYMPLSKSFTQQARVRLKDTMIQGFAGSETAKSIGIVEHYILGINRSCE